MSDPSKTSDLWRLSIAEAGRLVRDRRVSPVDLAEAALARIGEVDGRLSSFITVTADAARAEARAAEAEIAGGGWRGPLHGIPIGLKDIYETAGVRTTCHSRLLLDHVPSADAETVARLRAAGAVVMGKLATHEFAFGGPSHDLPFPPARNPWNTDCIPGGSSSGSGAAVSAGLVMGAMGSDTGGSIRGPAGLCGIAGLKPTYGLLSRRGVFPLSWTLDHAGPMARTVEDVAIMLQPLAGHDPLDPASARTGVPDYAAALTADLKGVRIGVARAWYDGPAGATPEQAGAIEAALAVMAGLGAEVRELAPPILAEMNAAGRLIILAEAFAIHRRNLIDRPEVYGRLFRERLRLGAFIPASAYVEAQRQRRRLTDAMLAAMAGVDVVVTASQYGPAETFDRAGATYPFFGKPYLTMPFNLTGQPALTLRCGMSAAGLPLALQIAGRPFDDATVLRVGHAYELARGGRDLMPPL